ncbi:MAG: carboxypeptidase regulatory-like domain-containing protein [Deltaproteobacteria bacterium]|nr:carboxypeptidase regulatory-like domain-containing protein [Deltaproteobacteria bacterium]
MKKWYMIIDVAKCEYCNNCFLACKDEHMDNDWQAYTLAQPRHGHKWMHIKRKERGQYPLIDVTYLPIPCMHCDDAPCVKAARDNAVIKREDGIVIIDPVKAKGQDHLVKACPYGAIWWNKEKSIPQKCTFCAHLLDQGWKYPRCVQACPTNALRALKVEEEDMRKIIQQENLETLYPHFKTLPRVFYKNLYRFFKCFIAGTVTYENNGVKECAEGAVVKLFLGQEAVAETTTDCFGDFKFDNLEQESGTYTLEVRFKDYPIRTVKTQLGQSHSIEVKISA